MWLLLEQNIILLNLQMVKYMNDFLLHDNYI